MEEGFESGGDDGAVFNSNLRTLSGNVRERRQVENYSNYSTSTASSTRNLSKLIGRKKGISSN